MADTERALQMARGLEREANSALEHLRTRNQGGQRVGFYGDFAGVASPSALLKIKWWTREIRRCLGDDAAEVGDA